MLLLLCSASLSAPALMHAFVGSLLRPVSSLQLSFSSGDALPSAVLTLHFHRILKSSNYTKDTCSLQPSSSRKESYPLSVLTNL